MAAEKAKPVKKIVTKGISMTKGKDMSTPTRKSPLPVQDSPFCKSNFKATPNSAFNRLSKLEEKTIQQMRRSSTKYREKKEEERTKKADQIKEDLEILANGVIVFKIPHRGKAKKTKFFVKKESESWIIYWDSKSKTKDTKYSLTECLCALGQGQGLHKERANVAPKQKDKGHSRLSFTLIFQERTVDLIALTQEDFDRWCRVLRHVGVILDTQSGYT